MDERTLVPGMLPIVPLDGRSNIPSSLPLDSIAARVVVPRDVKREEFVVEAPSTLPFQPTDMDARVIVPQGAAPPEIIAPSENVPGDIVEPDIFMTGEVNLLTTGHDETKAKSELVRNVVSVILHILLIAAIIFEPKIFPAHVPTQAELDLARKQITVLLPPGAFEIPKAAPRPKQPVVHVDPKVLRSVAPPEPKPTPVPAPKEPERVVKELPSAPVPQPNATPPPTPPKETAKVETPPPVKLEAPDQQPTPHGLILPKTSSPSGSIRDSIRNSSKMNAPVAVGGGQNQGGIPRSGGHGAGMGPVELLTDTQGVDFNDYLRRVYLTVRQNWYSVMPESVQLGEQGVVSLQFKIMRNGSVPTGDPARVFGSGKEPLDRAAVSSIRASNPFEPLPAAFKGDYIELRFTYYYNLTPPQQ
jgi:outer membrane biosynthesis protein TonB